MYFLHEHVQQDNGIDAQKQHHCGPPIFFPLLGFARLHQQLIDHQVQQRNDTKGDKANKHYRMGARQGSTEGTHSCGEQHHQWRQHQHQAPRGGTGASALADAKRHRQTQKAHLDHVRQAENNTCAGAHCTGGSYQKAVHNAVHKNRYDQAHGDKRTSCGHGDDFLLATAAPFEGITYQEKSRRGDMS